MITRTRTIKRRTTKVKVTDDLCPIEILPALRSSPETSVELSIGVGFGRFAIFSVLRYRTTEMPIREMTYLFVVFALPVMNSILMLDAKFGKLLFANGVVVALLFVFETAELDYVHQQCGRPAEPGEFPGQGICLTRADKSLSAPVERHRPVLSYVVGEPSSVFERPSPSDPVCLSSQAYDEGHICSSGQHREPKQCEEQSIPPLNPQCGLESQSALERLQRPCDMQKPHNGAP
jgi:hypothetical protein